MGMMEIAEYVKLLLGFIDAIDEEGLQLLEKAYEDLDDRISHNAAAFPIIVAMGGQWDGDEAELKAEEMRLVIELVKTRHKLKEYVIEKAGQRNRNDEYLRMLGIMGG